MGVKLFAVPSDSAVVQQLYAASFKGVSMATSLNYTSASFRDEDVSELCKVLKFSHAVKLILSHNSIGDEGAAFLCEVLAEKGKLRCLFIDYNQIGQDGARCFANMVAHLPSLIRLHINRN